MSSDGPDVVSPQVEEAVRGERALLDPVVRADADRIRPLLHPRFTEFGASGRVWNREGVIAALVGEESAGARDDVHDVDLTVREVAPGVVLLTYRAVRGDQVTLRSSLWVDDGDRMCLLHHQGTAVAGSPPDGDTG